MIFFSRNHNVLKYLVKWQENKENPEWLANPNVQAVLTDGQLDQIKLRDLFNDRGICTKAQFTIAVGALKALNLINDDLSVPPGVVAFVNRIREEHKADLRRIDEETALQYENAVDRDLARAQLIAQLADKDYI